MHRASSIVVGLLACAALATLLLAAPKVQAQLVPQFLTAPRAAHVGDTVFPSMGIVNVDPRLNDWVLTDILVTVFPSSQPIPSGCSTTDIPIPVPGATNVVLVCFGTTNTVSGVLMHPGDTLGVGTNYTVLDCDGKYSYLTFKTRIMGTDMHNMDDPPCPQGGTVEEAQDQISVYRPCISCAKTCTVTADGGTASVSFSGSVSNCGNIALTNVTVLDSQPVANTVVTNFGTNILFPNQIFAYSGSYKTSQGRLNVDTVTVSGTEQNRSQPVVRTPSDSCSSSCLASNTLFAAMGDASNLSLSFATATGHTYTVQFTASLSPADWHSLTNLPGDGNVDNVLDSATNAQRFYRVLTQ